jgi:hypothetical protein
MQLTFYVEDSLQEIVELPGNRVQIEAAAMRKIFELRDAWQAKQSRQPYSRGFIGTGTEKTS